MTPMREAQTAADFRDGRKSVKAQGQVNVYTDWVIDRLVGPYGTSRSDVVSRMLTDWVRQNREYLDEIGISPPQVAAGRLVITNG